MKNPEKSLSVFFTLFIFTLLVAQNAAAQTIRTVGGAGASYATLKQAFEAINAGAVTGTIILKMSGSTTETASAVLNASGTGSPASSYVSVTIYPTITGITISGNLNSALLDLNGADNITIDGRVNATGNTQDLTIANTSTGYSASTIRFINSAENNTVEYCTIKGSESSASLGIILFSTAAAGNGNDGNIIDWNNISGNAAGRAVNALYSEGSASRANRSRRSPRRCAATCSSRTRGRCASPRCAAC